MANVTKKDQRGFIDFRNLIVDLIEGDIEVFDNVKDSSFINPQPHMMYLIVFCRHGHLSLTSDKLNTELTGGNVMVCPPKANIRTASCSADFECRYIQLSDHLVQGLLRDRTGLWHQPTGLDQLSVISMSDASKEEFDFYFSLIGSKVRNRHEGAPHEIMLAIVRALLLEMCFVLEDAHGYNHDQRMSQGKVLFNRFMNLISNSEVKRQPIAYYADQLAITPKYLTMLCQKYSDKTASEWVVQYTIEEIRFYLKSSNLSIKEISARTGFANMSHFGSYVRKHLGMSPSEYRYSRSTM